MFYSNLGKLICIYVGTCKFFERVLTSHITADLPVLFGPFYYQ